MSEEPYTEGVEFILDEVIRYAQMTYEELKPHLKDLAFHDLKDAAGRRRIAGRPAVDRLRALTQRALEASPSARRLEFRRTFRVVEERFGETFIRADLPSPSEAELQGMFEAWIAEAAQDCRRRVHLIPCDIALDGVARVTVGPVTLHDRKTVWDQLEGEFSTYAQAEAGEGGKFREHAVTAAREYLVGFSEIAEVDVPDCDEPTSRATAEAALQTLLDFIHVLAGAPYTRRMRGPGPAIGADRRSAIVRDRGQLQIGYSVQGRGANISDAAWRQLTDDGHADDLGAMAQCLWAIVNRRELPALADRFVDGCAWYGDAAREPSPAAAAVKYVTVIERLLWTGEQGGTTRRVAERLAALCFSTDTWNFEEIEREVRDAYDLRSGLLHGRIPKNHPDVERRLVRCERHARDLLLSWLERFGPDFGAEISLTRLREYLDGFTAGARKLVTRTRGGLGDVPEL